MGRRVCPRPSAGPWLSSLLAVLLFVPVSGCGPDPCARAVQPVERAKGVEPGPLDRWPLLDAERWPTPRGAWQGSGRSWQEKVGPSGRDYPGPAALIAPPGHVGAQLTLLTAQELAAVDACARRPEGVDDWLGVAVPFRVGGAGACADLEACWAELDDLFEAGASLVLAEGLGELDPAEAARGPGLAWRTRRRVRRTETLHQLAAALPATSDGLLQRAERAHLVILEGAAVDLFERGELRLLDAVVRATGRRPVLRYPFESSAARPSPSGDRDFVLMGSHLALGGALMVRGPEPLPDGLEAARAWLRRHPELVQRSAASLQLYFDPLQPGGDSLSALARALDAAHVPWEVAVRPDGGLETQTLTLERLDNAPLLALSDVGAWPELAAALPPGAAVRLVVLDRERCLETLTPAVVAAGGQVVVVDPVGGTEHQDTGYAAARVETDLPPTVHVVRTAAPDRGLITHHLLNHRFDQGGRAVPVPASRLVATARRGLGARATCRAEWHLPGEQRSQELACTILGDGRIAVELPSFSTWAVLTTRLMPEDRSGRFGQASIRIQNFRLPWSGTTVSLEVPFLASDLLTTLSLPEWLHMQGRDPLALESMVHTVDVSPDGSSARLVSEGSGLRLERELRAYEDHVDVVLTLTNLGEETVRDARALVCLATKGGSPFPESGHAGTFFVDGAEVVALGDLPVDSGDPLYREDQLSGLGLDALPLTVMRSIDDRWSLGGAFESSAIVGGNGARGGACLHTLPRFGDLAPGAAVTRRGKVYLTRDGVLRLAQRWTEELGEARGAPVQGAPTDLSEVCGPVRQDRSR